MASAATKILEHTEEGLNATWDDPVARNLSNVTVKRCLTTGKTKPARLSAGAIAKIQKGVFAKRRCMETTLTEAGECQGRGKQQLRQRKGVLGSGGKKLFVYHLGAFKKHGFPDAIH